MSSPLLCDPADKAQLEADNGVEQLDYIAHLVNERRIEELRESHVLQLHELAIANVYPCGGQYRNALRKVIIEGSDHEVPHESQVPQLVRDLVDFTNASRTTTSGLERAACVLWRFNWIHPFAGGNGRTARALTYLALCMDLGMMMPGVPSVPRLIYERRDEYVVALRAADAGERNGKVDLVPMRNYLQDVVTRQMASAVDQLARSGG